jgi:site-specific recombinase XerD
MLFYRSGLRVSEVLALRVANLGRAPTWLIRAPGAQAQARLASSLALPSNQG